MQEEERVEARRVPMGESRKRKRGLNEAEVEQRNEKVRSLISDKAATLMEKSLKDRGFIVERGFNNETSVLQTFLLFR